MSEQSKAGQFLDSPADRSRSAGAVYCVVAVAFVVALWEADFSLQFAISAGLVSLAYLATTLVLGDRLDEGSSWFQKLRYFCLQLAILSFMTWLYVRYRTFGTVWLLFMPLVAQARMFLSSVATGVLCVVSLGLMAAHIATLSSWSQVPSSLLSVSTAIVFVLMFTSFAMREASARVDSQRLSEQLEKANRRLGEYAVEAEELAMVRERARMAREIHDSVGHSLTAVHMQIEAARTMLGRDPAKTRDSLDKAQACIKEGLSEIRSSVSSLRADPLEGRNLHGALADLADVSDSSGLPVDLRIDGRQRPLSQAVTLTLFRCAQEGLTNVRKHAKAKRVSLELDYDNQGTLAGQESLGDQQAADGLGAAARDQECIGLRIADDGQGCAQPDGGFGLLGLRERLRQLDGRLEVLTSEGKGLELRIEIPTAPFPDLEQG